jgi:ABC-2 type transport system permease protein
MALSSEWLIVRRDPAVWIASLILVLLTAGALANGHVFVRVQNTANDNAEQAEAREYAMRLAELSRYEKEPPPPRDPSIPNLYDPRSPYLVGQLGRTLVLPLQPLTLTSVGQFDLLPLQDTASIRTRQRTMADKYGLENPLNLLAGRFDMAFVIIYLLPLLIIAVTYNLVSLEREQGRLSLLAAQGLGPRAIFLRKLVLRGAAIFVPSVIAAVILILMWIGRWQPETGLRVLFWVLVIALYTGFWLSLALWVNSLRIASTVNATVLVAIWLLVVAVIPSAANIVVSMLRPAPSRIELLATIRDSSIDQRRDGKHLAEQFYAEHPEFAPASGIVMNLDITGTMTHIEQDRRTLPLEQRFEQQLAEQQNLVRRLRFLSPAIVAQEALNDIAGTGLLRYQRFRKQGAAFREQWTKFFHPLIFSGAQLRPADYGRIPQFTYRDEPTTDVAGRVLIGVAGILLPSLLIGALGANRLGRT